MTYAKGFGANKSTREYLDEFDAYSNKAKWINANSVFEEESKITMCINAECQKRHECLRFTKTPSEHQYSGLYGKMNGENGCNYFFEPKI